MRLVSVLDILLIGLGILGLLQLISFSWLISVVVIIIGVRFIFSDFLDDNY